MKPPSYINPYQRTPNENTWNATGSMSTKNGCVMERANAGSDRAF